MFTPECCAGSWDPPGQGPPVPGLDHLRTSSVTHLRPARLLRREEQTSRRGGMVGLVGWSIVFLNKDT